MERSSRQKINKKIQALNDTLEELYLLDIYRAFHPRSAEYICFSSAHRTFSRIDHILDHKVSLGKFKKTNHTKHLFWSQHCEIRNKLQEKTLRNTNTGWLNNMLLNNHWITEEIKEEIKKIPRDTWKWKHDGPKLRQAAETVLRGKFIAV